MTPEELNITYECLVMIDTCLPLILREARKIQKVCQDAHIYHTELKSKNIRSANEIIAMAASIERRKASLFKLIDE